MSDRPDTSSDVFGLDAVREVLRLIHETDISELLIERGDAKLHVKRGVPPQPSQSFPVAPILPTTLPSPLPSAPLQPVFQSAPAPEGPPVETPAGHTVLAPMVGTFYAAPSPKDAPFVQEGDEVRIGDTIGIIEAMKMMNEIEADAAGRIARILVKNGQPVEYGQPLMVIEPL
ncbi:MAG: acetyl-CoA carboxylase biotin carboxyl carrier protein [Oscillochloridaceae bacterium]|nr:acetyl-CoA carboxylase biotin carboxyl carrier protein [Chloroflexaceae bacterium]MDW8391577.1 acetyl-CoA carboxylase biotin carboxyl carrier protein [Oscillochloridaceae bacterium]